MHKVLVVLALFCATVGASHAQERTAGSVAESQMTWTALKGMVDSAIYQAKGANMTANDARTRSLKIEVCGKKTMLYAPGDATADADGCKSASDSNVTKVIECGKTGMLYNSTSNSCTTSKTSCKLTSYGATRTCNWRGCSGGCGSGEVAIQQGSYSQSSDSNPGNSTNYTCIGMVCN